MKKLGLQFINRPEKIVRGRVVERIRRDGEIAISKRLSKSKFLKKLLTNKLPEEVAELQKAKTREEQLAELADVIEVVRTIIRHLGFRHAQVELARLRKMKTHGDFRGRIFLESYTSRYPKSKKAKAVASR